MDYIYIYIHNKNVFSFKCKVINGSISILFVFAYSLFFVKKLDRWMDSAFILERMCVHDRFIRKSRLKSEQSSQI